MENKFFLPEKGKPVRPRVEELKNIPEEDIRPETLPIEHGVKHEMYALATFLIERYHEKAKEILGSNSEKSLYQLRSNSNIAEAVSEALILKNGQISFDNVKIENIPEDDLVTAWKMETFFPSVYQQAFESAFSEEKKNFDARALAVHQRLSDLFHKTQVRLVVSPGSATHRLRAQSVEGFIKTGVVTATTETWNILLAVVEKYQQEFGELLTEERLESMSPDLKKILNQVASLHIADFEYLRNLKIEPGQPNPRQVAWDKILTFSGSGLETHVALKQEYKNLEQADRMRKECTQGCPARDAIIVSDKGKKMNVIGDVFDFQRELFTRVVLPYQAILVESQKKSFE